MAKVSAADIKALRERTGAGMGDVKKALEEAEGNMDAAIEIIRKRGLAKAAKREGNAAKEGLVAVRIKDLLGEQVATIIELNAETDFVVKNDKFKGLADDVLAAISDADAADVESALNAPLGAGTVSDAITEASGTMGERLVLGRVHRIAGPRVTEYLHRTSPDLPPSLGVVVVHEAGVPSQVARQVAQHISFAAPTWRVREDVPADVVTKETEIAREMAVNEGKPEAALPKIVEGRMTGFYKENVLDEQPFALDPKTTVGKYVADNGGKVLDFARVRVGS